MGLGVIRAFAIFGLGFCAPAISVANGADLSSPAPRQEILPPVAKAPAIAPSLLAFYVGGGASLVHHTGYLPDPQLRGTPWNVGEYRWGWKAYAGYRLSDALQFELAYQYLGEASFPAWFAPGQERAQAVTGSILYAFPPLSSWGVPTPGPVNVLLRLGLAYKDVTQTSLTLADLIQGRPAETFQEGFLAGVLGAMVEWRFTQRLFARFEYEFVSTAIGGPPEAVPELRGLFKASFGSTRRVVNLMNTPLSVSLGGNF